MNFDHSLWGLIVPDGSRFCHWGGRTLSCLLAQRLALCSNDIVLDLCCGEGGLTDYLHAAGLVVGIDISPEAIVRARRSVQHPNACFMTADARCLPFGDQKFSAVVSQDADAWMHADTHVLMQEIARVTKPGGTFLWQSYVTREKPLFSTTARLLKYVGYSCHDMPEESAIPSMFLKNGFSIESVESLHEEYAQDNLRMLNRALILLPEGHDLFNLLQWEKELFEKNLWTGVLVTAKRNFG